MSGNTFETLDAFLDEYLELPVRGRDGQVRVYRIEEPSAEDGLRIERITSLAARLAAGGKAPDAPVLGDDEELDLYRMCLGDAYEELRAELKWGAFKHVALTAMFWVTTDADTARQYWATGQQPGKAPTNRAERRAQGSRGSSASAAASTTPSPVSTSGTRAASQPRSKRRRGRPQS
ncbi:hypothetical protein [Streptomyces sp. SID161]|uniref:DUF7426 family protein n=1 Tax=Streptomyces sp. SID161 TaxID=2690251 RepID=UPI00136F7C57|nr:hypothetical protein [Streptomyces sp. SID161]MYW48886.1 hypothetical protein [Streptomyces sp. SID161]MYW49829.1 hypothetical protein [Streptomyces sp. SID161]